MTARRDLPQAIQGPVVAPLGMNVTPVERCDLPCVSAVVLSLLSHKRESAVELNWAAIFSFRKVSAQHDLKV